MVSYGIIVSSCKLHLHVDGQSIHLVMEVCNKRGSGLSVSAPSSTTGRRKVLKEDHEVKQKEGRSCMRARIIVRAYNTYCIYIYTYVTLPFSTYYFLPASPLPSAYSSDLFAPLVSAMASTNGCMGKLR